MKVYIVYFINDLTTNLKYIGSTCRPVSHRFSAHWASRNKSNLLHSAMRLRGKESFKIYAICCSKSKEDIRFLEEFFIYNMNTLHPNGYNMKVSGINPLTVIPKELVPRRHPELTLLKMSLRAKGRKHNSLSRSKMSENRRITQLGDKNNFYGRNHSEETKKILSDKAKERIRLKKLQNNPG